MGDQHAQGPSSQSQSQSQSHDGRDGSHNRRVHYEDAASSIGSVSDDDMKAVEVRRPCHLETAPLAPHQSEDKPTPNLTVAD